MHCLGYVDVSGYCQAASPTDVFISFLKFMVQTMKTGKVYQGSDN
jgi:hypothetical protein